MSGLAGGDHTAGVASASRLATTQQALKAATQQARQELSEAVEDRAEHRAALQHTSDRGWNALATGHMLASSLARPRGVATPGTAADLSPAPSASPDDEANEGQAESAASVTFAANAEASNTAAAAAAAAAARSGSVSYVQEYAPTDALDGYLASIGVSLTPHQQASLQQSLITLQQTHRFQRVQVLCPVDDVAGAVLAQGVGLVKDGKVQSSVAPVRSFVVVCSGPWVSMIGIHPAVIPTLSDVSGIGDLQQQLLLQRVLLRDLALTADELETLQAQGIAIPPSPSADSIPEFDMTDVTEVQGEGEAAAGRAIADEETEACEFDDDSELEDRQGHLSSDDSDSALARQELSELAVKDRAEHRAALQHTSDRGWNALATGHMLASSLARPRGVATTGTAADLSPAPSASPDDESVSLLQQQQQQELAPPIKPWSGPYLALSICLAALLLMLCAWPFLAAQTDSQAAQSSLMEQLDTCASSLKSALDLCSTNGAGLDRTTQETYRQQLCDMNASEVAMLNARAAGKHARAIAIVAVLDVLAHPAVVILVSFLLGLSIMQNIMLPGWAAGWEQAVRAPPTKH